MPELVDIVIEEDRWISLGIETIAQNAAQAALCITGLQVEGFEISLLACDDTRIKELNAEFRNKGTATNVLSWPAIELAPEKCGGQPKLPSGQLTGTPEIGLGDIAIAYETCLHEAKDLGVSITDHTFHLIVHGCLHLLGYDHEQDADATVMQALETKALASMGIADPYR